MTSIDSALLEVVQNFAIAHGLGSAALLSLADKLDSDEGEEIIPDISHSYNDLIRLLADTKEPIPEYLGASRIALSRYTEDQMDTIILAIEAHFWKGATEHHLRYFWHWLIVFCTPRQVQRDMVFKSEMDNLEALLPAGARPAWLDTLPKRYFGDYGLGYVALRELYFSTGIDDAVSGFLAHYRNLYRSKRNLRRRVVKLADNAEVSHGTLLPACRVIIARAESLLADMLKQARKWHKADKEQRELAKLPGHAFGLKYGEDIYHDFDMDTLWVKPNVPDTTWFSVGGDHSPLRTTPGSPWRDWLRNVAQPDPATVRHHHPACEAGHYEHTTDPGPFELRLPEALLTIWDYFRHMHQTCRHELEKHGVITDKPVHPQEREKKAKELSRSTGEDYWRVREYRREQTDLLLVNANQHLLETRPRYDAAGNLRLDYMNAILAELATGEAPAPPRTQQSVAIFMAP